MISVCHVQVLPLLSGVQRAMLDMFEHLDPARYQLHVACQKPGPLTEELARRGLVCHYIPALDRPIRPWRDARAYHQLRRLFLDEQFDLVHTHSSKPGILARIAARRAGVRRVVHHVHGFAFHNFSPAHHRWAYGALEKLAGAYCDRVIFVNRALRELAIRDRLLPAEKCLTIYNGVDLHKFSPAERARGREDIRAALEFSPDETVILVSGRLDRQKQSLILPDIAARLDALRPDAPWRMLIVGEGQLERPLARRLRELDLEHRVMRLGWQTEPARMYAAADVLLLPSLWEGLSLSLLEAQAAGLPVVASDIMGNREVVAPNSGVLCEPCDAECYAQALVKLVASPSRRASLGAAGRRRAEEHFDRRTCFRRVADLYDQLLAGMPSCPAMSRRAA